MHGVQGQMDNYGQMGEKVSDADRTKSWGVPALSGNIVENQPETGGQTSSVPQEL